MVERLRLLYGELEQKARMTANEFGRSFPTAAREAGIQIDGTSRHPKYTFNQGFLKLDLDEREVRQVLKLAARLGRVDEIRHDHFFARRATAEMVEIAAEVAGLAEQGAFPAGHFRDRVNNGRKVAIEILEFFDRQGVTIRRGDLRRINPHRLDLYREPAPDTGEGREPSPVGVTV